ncbi:hypothetical protein [Crossiella cryophila]|uniref:ABC-type transport system involved in multi-copper enzyme maturation permease subunit n=1 Tax=Crossiella cryophila TaxID=43355 RepID=A0A7W7C7V7_9PSEU|nr:hypothetical protein [Crossiella cryophila]MBB4676110.1 ABC-type transport system involved in multi-copper enzyme maturation permease subunit [Crossiella cryophila]
MTTSLTRSTPQRRRGAGTLDLAWVTWRQHRWLIVGTALAVAALAGFYLYTYFAAVALPPCGASCPDGGSSPALKDLIRRAGLTEYPVLVFAGFIAAFWGAPLLSQEFEHRTHLWAWTQDISATRWLTTRILGLVAVITVLTSALGLAGTFALRQLHELDSSAFPPFTSFVFGLWPPLQVAYALFGFALGVAVSAISRRTVISMLVTLLGFTAVRFFVAEYLRPHYLTPMRIGTPLGERAADLGGEGLTVGTGYLNTSGETMRWSPVVDGCRAQADQVVGATARYSEHQAALNSCLGQRGWTQTYLDYQPAERLLSIQLIETGIFLGLAIVLLAVALRLVHRMTTL